MLGLKSMLDAFRGASADEQRDANESTPEWVSRADAPWDSILDAYVAGFLGVANAAAARKTCRAWCTALGNTRTIAQLVHREAMACGRAPPLGFAAAIAYSDGPRHAWRLARAALRRRKLVVGERWAAASVHSMRAVRSVTMGNFADRNRWAGTKFLLLNETEAPLYVHWINFDGTVEVREGDRVEPRRAPLTRGGYIFGIYNPLPPGVFYHVSIVSHSFAICLEPGEPPIACYQMRRSFLPFSFGRTWIVQHAHGVAVRRGANGLEVHELACAERKILHEAPADAQTRVSFDHIYITPLDATPPMRRIRVEPLHVRVPPRSAEDFAWSTEVETEFTLSQLACLLAGIDLPEDRREWPGAADDAFQWRELEPTQHGCPISYAYADTGGIGQMLWENIWRGYDSQNSPAGPRYAFEGQ